MRIMLISHCSKKALVETRRIIDHFAERKGDCVWETHITQQGLETLKKLLMSTARKNTAVACHLFRGYQQTQLLWIVGNDKKFNRQGAVPTNITKRNVLRKGDENHWHTGEAIAILAALAGLFHDFGKSTHLFQKKLKAARPKPEPFRHEWISLILFAEFVGSSSDREWLERLARISEDDEAKILENFSIRLNEERNPLKDLPPLAKFIGWLIVSHHFLPSTEGAGASLSFIEMWMDGEISSFSADWNLNQLKFKQLSEKEQGSQQKAIRTFPHGTPCKSKIWQKSAQGLGARSLKYYHLLQRNWFEDRFTMHLARTCLMAADHIYSAGEAHPQYQDPACKLYANTHRLSKDLKQKLDEHIVRVTWIAFKIATSLPQLQKDLPSIPKSFPRFKRRNTNPKFVWQDHAYDLACKLKESSHERGFFGVNLASTGCGKTLANARIMHGLSDEQGCRFSIALGLRTLTLQTGDALKKKLNLTDEDIAVLIGCQASQEMYQQNKQEEDLHAGSESEEDALEFQDIFYSGKLSEHLQKLLVSKNKLHKLVCAPILVCTIDHLILATEGIRGGKQISPMLRLMTSDLVLDEPDDFDLGDLPALCRLVNFAGVLGSRVLLSSATLAPAIVHALFEAYSAGRKVFNRARRSPELEDTIPCAWFDEFQTYHLECNSESYLNAHEKFIDKRIDYLEKQPILRRAALSGYGDISKICDPKETMADLICSGMYELHDCHHQIHPDSGKKLSVGLVRMANIDPLVAISKLVLTKPVKPGYHVHFCVYHSRFPMLMRSNIEGILDKTLQRSDKNAIWQLAEIKIALAKGKEQNHLFIVFATSVAEVGRDHDYDWTIVEPSSMRSIIQVAGRVQRHRQIQPQQANIVILQSNLKGFKGEKIAFTKPGFEKDEDYLESKDLKLILNPIQFEVVTAIPRLHVNNSSVDQENLVNFEHKRLKTELFGSEDCELYAGLWTKYEAHWCAVLQKYQPFRKSNGEVLHLMLLENEDDEPKLCRMEKNEMIDVHSLVNHTFFKAAERADPWMEFDLKEEIVRCSYERSEDFSSVSRLFCKVNPVNLKKIGDGRQWQYHPLFGFYEEI